MGFYEKFGNSPYLRLILVLLVAFIFVLLFAYVREHVFKISMKGAIFGFFLGVIFVLLFDLIVLVTISDRGKLQSLFSGEKRQEALGELIVSGVSNLNQTLGVATIVSPRKPKTAQEVIGYILSLPDEEAQKIKDLLCPN